jgi:hypothetical protein
VGVADLSLGRAQALAQTTPGRRASAESERERQRLHGSGPVRSVWLLVCHLCRVPERTGLRSRARGTALPGRCRLSGRPGARCRGRPLRCTTFFGRFGLGEDGRQFEHGVLVVQWRAGVKRIVWPPEVAETELGRGPGLTLVGEIAATTRLHGRLIRRRRPPAEPALDRPAGEVRVEGDREQHTQRDKAGAGALSCSSAA